MHALPQRKNFFWSPQKIQRFCAVVLAVLAAHIIWTYTADTARTSLLKRGDFPSFYAAGMIVRQKLAAQLYDTKLLAYIQNLYWPSLRGNYISFPYPPFAALGLSVFALFPPYAAKFLFTVCMTAALAAAVFLTRLRAACFRSGALPLSAFFLGFFPISFGILGSQFSSLNMLLYAGLIAGISRGSRAGETWAGISAGLWLFKPQYGLFFVWLLVLARYWRAALAASAVGVVYFFMGVLVQGPQWPFVWLSAALQAASIDFTYNHFNMVSLSGFFHSLNGIFSADGSAARFFDTAGILVSIALAAFLSFLFFKIGGEKSPDIKRTAVQGLLALAGPVMLLASPHALFYDLGILVISCAPYAKLDGDARINLLIALTASVSVVTAFKNWLPFQPLLFLAVGVFIYLLRKIKKEG